MARRAGTGRISEKGAYSNIATLTSLQFEDIVGYYFIDETSPDGNMSGVLVSPVIIVQRSVNRAVGCH